MKVLYVGADAVVSGAGFSMVTLVKELDKLGIDVVPVVHHGNSEKLLSESNRSHYIVDAWSWALSNRYSPLKKWMIMHIKKVLNIRCRIQYERIIKKETPDIIHINALTSYPIAQAAVKCGKPFVWHIREMLEEGLNSSFWNEKEAYDLMNKASFFIAVSKCVEQKYKTVVGSDRIRCIYNGVDKNLYYKPDHIVMNKNVITITMAGRINESKGQLACLQELIPVLQTNPNVVLQFAGEGNEAYVAKLKEIRDQAGLQGQVKFPGFVKKMDLLWEETDIAIVQSRFEAFGRVTVEAKMAGVLVVGYNSGGTTELIEDKIDGFLFGNGYKTLREVVEGILNDKGTASLIAQCGRERVKDVFTSENNAREIARLYSEVLHVQS